MKIAYVRVSTADQNEGRQKEALSMYNIEKWYIEKVSGKNMEREQLQLMLDFVREGDEVYIHDFSRLSRSTKDLLSILDLLRSKSVRLVSLKEDFDINSPTGQLMITLLGAIAEFERSNILERQREGIELAKKQKKYTGRKPKPLDDFENVYKMWKDGKVSVSKICKDWNISRTTFYNKVRLYESDNKDDSDTLQQE